MSPETATHPTPQATHGRGWRIAFCLLLLSMGLALRMRTFWPDEGWYLLSGRELLAGRLPYRDFLYPQMPGVLALSAFLQGLGVETLFQARLAWGLCGLLALWMAADLARRLFDADSPTRFWWLSAASPFVAVGFITCCSWSPAALGSVLPFWWLARFGVKNGALVAVGVASMVAFSMKLSLAPLWLGVLVAVVASGGRLGFFLLGTLLGALPILALALSNLPGFIYGVFGMHSAQGATDLWFYRALKTLFGTVAGLGALLWALGLSLPSWVRLPLTGALDQFMSDAPPEERLKAALPQSMLIGLGGSTLLHFLPVTVGELYHLHVIPLAMVLAVGVVLPNQIWRGLLLTGLLTQLGLVIQLHQLEPRSTTLALSWPDPRAEQDRIRTAIRPHLPPQTPVFTLEAWLLWEEKLPLVHGVELGPYSLQRTLAFEACAPLRTLSPACVLARITQEKPGVVALTQFDLQFFELQALPELLSQLGYQPVANIPEVGMPPSTLRVWIR